MELDVLGAAVALGVSPDTVRRRIRAGGLPAHRDATGKWLVDLDEEITTATAPPTAGPAAFERLREELLQSQNEAARFDVRIASLETEAARLQEENRGLRSLLDEVRASRDRAYADAAELWTSLGTLMLTLERRKP